MKRDDLFLFSLTFFTGLVVGGYVYVAAFKPVYAPNDIDRTETSATEFSVVGQTYGGFMEEGYIQPSFRVLANGSYNYVAGGSGEGALGVSEGSLPRNLTAALKQAVYEANLDMLSREVERNNCAHFSDGQDYEYKITVAGDYYTLDTCFTALQRDDELSIVLQEVWSYLRSTDTRSRQGASAYESFFGDGLAGLFLALWNDTKKSD